MISRSTPTSGQIDFVQRLKTIRITCLQEALSDTVDKCDISEIERQLHEYVRNNELKILARRGMRGEIFFPVPCLLEKNPRLLSYYRLLSGISQRDFYKTMDTGFRFSQIRSEGANLVDFETQRHFFQECCQTFAMTGSMLLNAIDCSDLSETIFKEFLMLMIGSQLKKGTGNLFEKQAVQTVYELIRDILQDTILEEKGRMFVLQGDFKVIMSQEPDICIVEQTAPGKYRNVAALNVKGTTDTAGAPLYLAEIERAHAKVKAKNFKEYWALIGFDVNYGVASQETPSTTRFFYIPELLLKDISEEYKSFRESILKIVDLEYLIDS